MLTRIKQHRFYKKKNDVNIDTKHWFFEKMTLTNSIYLQIYHHTYFNIGYDKIDVKMMMLVVSGRFSKA